MPKDITQLILATDLGHGAINGITYTPINPSGLPFATFEIHIINDTDVGIFISTDGTNLYEYVRAGETRTLYGQQNSGPGNQKAYFPVGMIFYALGAPTTGAVYLTGLYQPN